jgi:peptidoglycan/xylan/chitin deacetylase (PgdA/CDA1 family)
MARLRWVISAPLAFGYWCGLAGAALRNDGRARILAFHGTPARRARQLKSLLRYLKKRFDIVSLQALASHIATGNWRQPGRLALTFDDGLKSNVEVAYPILRELSIPATFFVCPGLVEERRWLWNHEARQRLMRLDAHALVQLAASFGCAPDPERMVQHLKSLDLESRRLAEEEIRSATPGFTPTAEERGQFDVAQWPELRALDPRIVTLGSHTLSHPILTSLPEEELEREVGESRRLLEERTRRPVTMFAYPNGDFDRGARDCVRRHYAAAVSVQGESVAPPVDLHALSRIATTWNPLRTAFALHGGMHVDVRRHALAASPTRFVQNIR